MGKLIDLTGLSRFKDNIQSWTNTTKINKPTNSPDGTAGQLLRTNGDGSTAWVDQGLPTDEQVATAVTDWLDDHPEATTTVEDGSITYVKLNSTLQEQIDTIPELSRKADVDGYYETMTVGDAEQLVATVGAKDNFPYTFRVAGGGIEIGDREVDKIVGGTVAWNQLVDENTESVTLISGHRYAACVGSVWSIGKSNGTAISTTGGTDQVFDLSIMFGSTVANYINTLETANPGAGVAWFRALFPKDYYAYDAGTLRSVQVSAHKMVGFNAYDNETGKALVIGGSEYEITGTYTALSLDGETITPVDGRFTPAKSGELTVTGGNGTTCVHLRWDGERDGEFEPYKAHVYPLDCGLELRGIPRLDANNRLYYDGDEYDSNGAVTRKYGIIDLGTLDWLYIPSSESRPNPFFVADYPDLFYSGQIIRCAKYEELTPAMGWSQFSQITNDKVINSGTGTNARYLKIRDTAYTTKEAFKAAMSGVYLLYSVITPTADTADPYQNPQAVDDFGTEQYIDAGNRDVEIPVGHDTFYRQNLRAKLESAPDSPNADGDYLLRRSNGQNSYVTYMPITTATVEETKTYLDIE